MQKILHKQRHLWAALFTVLTMFGSWSAQAQVNLTTSPYTENFDGIGAGLPTGWSARISANATSLGTVPTLVTATTAWNNTATNFRNCASADGSTAADNTATQAANTDRVLAVRQTGTAGYDPGASFVLQLANTTGKTDFNLAFKLQSLDNSSPRITLWRIDYAIGNAPTSFTTITTVPASLPTGNSLFTNTNVNVNFGTALDNQTNNVWIRVIALAASTGSGNRATTGIDDVSLSFSSAPPTPPDIAISSPAQTTAGNVAQGTTNHILSAFQLAITTGAANLTGLTVTTAGNYAAADLTNLKVRYSTDNILDGGDATLSTITPTTAGTQTFTPFAAQSIPVGNGFIFVTADVAAGAIATNTISVGAIAPADITFTSSASKTGSASAAGVQTIVPPTAATVALSSPAQIAAADVPQGTNNRVISAFQLGVTTANANLTGLTITTAGTYVGTDLNNLKVWYQNNGTFNAGTATLLSTKTAGLGAGTQAFTPFTAQTITNATTGFIFVTADVAMTANVGATINVNAIANTDLTFTAATVTGSAAIGGTQTVTLTVGTTIAAARAMALGTVVTLTGTVTVARQFGGTIYMQDATGGIAIFDNRTGNPLFNDANLAVGKFLTITGTLAEFQPTTGVAGSGLLQVSTLTAHSVGAVNPVAVVPKLITGAMVESDESTLIQFNNPTFNDRGLFMPGRNYAFNHSSQTNVICRSTGTFESNFNLLGSDIPQTVPSMIGVQGQFRGAYQYQPRQNSDVNNAAPFTPSFATVPVAQTLEVVTFNMLWFGFQANSTIVPATQKANMLAAFQAMDADVYMVQEVVDAALFQSLVTDLGIDYAGVLSPCISTSGDPAQAQKVGFIYRKSVIAPDMTVNGGNIVCYLSDYVVTGYPTGNASQFWASGRFPAMLTVNATLNGVTTRLRLISLHSKANTTPGTEGYNRRVYDFNALKQRLDADFPTDRIIIGGDHNEDADFTVASNFTPTTVGSFNVFVASTNFKYVTKTLSDNRWRSYVADYTEMIDHMAVSDELYDEYLPNTTLIPNMYGYPAFLNQNFDGKTTSDHFPVMMRVALHKPIIKVLENVTNIPNNNVVITDYGTTTIGNAVLKTFTINNTGLTDLTLSGLTLPAGYVLVGTFPSSVAAGGTTTFQVQLTAVAAGTFNGNIQFTTNDVVANPFTFPIIGIVNATGCPTITVNPATITATATTGTAYTNVTFTATGGTAPHTFTVSSGALPTGMTLIAGVLSGNPTVSGTYNFTVTATDASVGLCTGSRSYSIVVSCPTVTATPTPAVGNGSVGTAYTNVTFAGAGGTAPYTFAVSAGTLPAGLTLTAAGVLAGTPTAAGTSNFSVTTTDANNCTSIAQLYTIIINCATGFTIDTQPTAVSLCGTPNATFTVAATPASGVLSYQWQESIGVNPFTNISNNVTYGGATTATLTLAGVGASFDGRSYRCIVTNNGCDLTTNAAALNVNIAAVATFSYAASPYCSSVANPNPTFTGGGIAGNFTATPAGLVFVSTTTGQINLAASTAGTYNVVNTILAAGACPEVTANTNVTINAAPTITIGAVTSVAVGATSFSLPYSATTGTQYSISAGTPNAMPLFAPVVNAAITASPITVTIPNTAPAGLYNFNLTVNNATCPSTIIPFTVQVGASTNNAMSFDGTNDYVACTNSALLRPTAAVTLEVWAFRNSWTTGMTNSTIAGNFNAGGYAIFNRANNAISVGVRANGSSQFIETPTTSFAAGWHHFALTFDGRFERLFVDGIEAVNRDLGANFPIQYAAAANTFIIGAEASNGAVPSAGEYFAGSIDEVRVWTVAKTCSQLLQLNKRELVGNEANLVAYYNFNQGVAGGTNTGLTTVNNLSPNGATLNGTATSLALTGATSNWVDGSANGVIVGTPVAQPEINVQGNAVNIPKGDITPIVADNTDFGSTPISAAITKTFVIQNSDTGNLTVTAINFTGTNASEFTLVTPPTFPATVTTATPLTITVQFLPTAAGTRNATINVLTNDCDEATYDFALRGTALTPTITVSAAALTAFTTCVGTPSAATQNYTVSGTNLGANIVITAPTGYEISSTGAAPFFGTLSLAPTAQAVAITTITVRLTGATAGTPAGDITHTSTAATTQNKAVTGTVSSTSITLGAVTNIFTTATTFTLPYSAVTGAPNQYSIASGTPNAMGGFTAVPNTVLPVSPITVTVPASVAGTYNFNLTVRNTVTGCSSVVPFTVQVGAIVLPPPPPPPARSNQTITFDSIPNQIFGSQLVELLARASSGLPVSFEVLSGNGVLAGQNFVTLTGLGTIVVRASQAGNSQFFPAAPVTRTITVIAASQTLTGFETIADRPWNSSDFQIRAVTNSNLPVTFTITEGANIAEIRNGNIVTLKPAIGKVTITATQAGNGTTNAATPIVRSFNVTKADQVINSVSNVQTLTYRVGLTQTLSASATSGLAVTASVVSGNATITNNVVSFTTAGTVVVRYAQAGNDLWNAATSVDRTIVVEKANQNITLTSSPAPMLIGTSQTVVASASSGLPVTMRVVSGTATINGLILTPTDGSSVEVELNQAGDANYNAATPVRFTISIIPTLSLTSVSGTKFCGGAIITVNFVITGAFSPNNRIIAYLSDANGVFTNDRRYIGSIDSKVSGSITGIIPENIPSGKGYKVRMESIFPVVFSAVSTQTLELNAVPEMAVISQDGAALVSSIASGVQWFANGLAISGATSQRYTPTAAQAAANTLYSVVITNASGCTSVSGFATYQPPIVTGIDNPALSAKLSVYPNPTENKITVELGLENVGTKSAKVGIKLTDAAGRIVFNENVSTNGLNFKHDIDMKDLASGVYMLLLNVEGKTAVKRIVKQ